MVLRLEGSWSLLVGKRFLSLLGDDEGPWDTERVAEWPWKAGRIRAVSHTDISKPDLKVSPSCPAGLRGGRSPHGDPLRAVRHAGRRTPQTPHALGAEVGGRRRKPNPVSLPAQLARRLKCPKVRALLPEMAPK